MALDKGQLKTEIINLMTDMRTRTENADNEYADRLVNAIDDYVKGATVVYQNGLIAPQGPVTGTFNGNLQ